MEISPFVETGSWTSPHMPISTDQDFVFGSMKASHARKTANIYTSATHAMAHTQQKAIDLQSPAKTHQEHNRVGSGSIAVLSTPVDTLKLKQILEKISYPPSRTRYLFERFTYDFPVDCL